MNELAARRRLIAVLRSAYSGELAAGLAYRGHRAALRNADERAAIAKIEGDEWTHRREVGALLGLLGAKPQPARELLMRLIGISVGASCHLGNWILPMYFAGRLEHANIHEYEDGATYAHALGLPAFEHALLEMAEAERAHDAFFSGVVSGHPWLPMLERLFSWPNPAPSSGSVTVPKSGGPLQQSERASRDSQDEVNGTSYTRGFTPCRACGRPLAKGRSRS